MRKLLGRWIREREVRRREREAAELPEVGLPWKLMTNLKGLPDRSALLSELPRNGVVAEIGVAEGDFAAAIQEVCAPEKLYLIDQWNTNRYPESMMESVYQRFEKAITSDEIVIVRDQSVRAASQFPNAYLDWIYIDTDHSYEMTKQELEAYAPKIKPEGIIAGHDFMQGNWVKGLRYGVIEVVYEFCTTRQWELLYLTLDFRECLSFGIRKMA